MPELGKMRKTHERHETSKYKTVEFLPIEFNVLWFQVSGFNLFYSASINLNKMEAFKGKFGNA